MATAGIVAEYNPFHRGHAWHIARTRRTLGADTAVVCVMSGHWVQRGGCALTDKWSRAALALSGGELAALGLDYVYLCQPVPRGRCREWLECAKFAGYAGFNATMPHKEELVELMDELDGDARLFGAVNTVCIRDGRAYGYNTDGAGFLRALNDEGIDPAGKRVLVLGAGGAAKAVCLKLAQAGAEVVVCNRTADKAAALCAHEPARLRPAGFDPDTLRRKAAECGLLVNCTSLGMEGAAGQFEEFSFLDALPARAPVVDLIYAPAETELLRRARGGGHQTANGFGLLVNQAVLSLEHFTGTAIDAAEMKRRLADVLLP